MFTTSTNTCKRGHTIFNPSCRSCLELKNHWYHYLEQSGFEQKESIINFSYQKDFSTKQTFDAKCQYFQWARGMLTSGSFSSLKDKLIWECHADGLSRRQISPRVGFEQSWVTRKIHGIEDYLKKQK